MELVVLGKMDRNELLESIEVQKTARATKKDMEHKIEIYNPSPTEGVVDIVISEKLSELKRAETKKIKTEEIETGKFKNAWAFTDIPATVKKAGFHSDGSPKIAIAGLFDEEVRFIVRDGWAKYCSDSLSVVLADVKNDWKNLIVFFVGLAGVIASMLISITAPLEYLDFYNWIVLVVVGILIPLITLIHVSVPTSPKYGSYFTYIMLPDIGKIRTRSNFYAKVPPVPEKVLTKISGQGPFAILFEVTEGWRKVCPDPVILRVIMIGDKQFFEPVVGYDMTPLEKKSLTELV